MNRWLTLLLIGLAGLLASCGTSVRSSTQPGAHDEYSVVVSPDQFTLNAGDWSGISAAVELSNQNSTPRAVSPQPTLKFLSSDPRVTVSPAGEVCAGQWDSTYKNCALTVFPPGSAKAGQLDLPTGYVTITAYDASHGVGASTLVSIHPRATGITLGAQVGDGANLYPATGCVSQSQQVKYNATPVDANGPVANCSNGHVAGCVNDNDYTWSVGDPNVASVNPFGDVIARNPGVTNVYARLNGTVSVPLAFATCPPASIVLESSAFTKGVPFAPFSTADLDGPNSLNEGDQKYFTITEVRDAHGNLMQDTTSNLRPLPPITLPINFISTDLPIGSFSSVLPRSSDFVAIASGRTTVMAACEPSACNPSVADFFSPTGKVSAKSAGFGYPVYSNVIGVTVKGATGSTVLVTGTEFADGTFAPHVLLAYDSESLAITHTVALPNLPNSLVVAPNGLHAYLGNSTVGSSGGLVVVDLTAYESTFQTYQVAGGLSTDVVTGKVLGVSPDSRYVVISDIAADRTTPRNDPDLVYLIDTIGTKIAVPYRINGIRAVTFAPDNSNFWIAGDSGVYTFLADTFVLKNASSPVNALAWAPDGQSYFASSSSSDSLADYSTCDDKPNPPSLAGGPINLAVTAIEGVPHVIGLSPAGTDWLDYSVLTSAQIDQVVAPIAEGNVCLSTVKVNAPVSTMSSLPCTPKQITFSATREEAYVTGVADPFSALGTAPSCPNPDSFIHGYSAIANPPAEIELPTNLNLPIIPLSGGVLSDGRKLYVGTYDSTSKTALLHRFDLATRTEDVSQTVIDPTTGKPVTIFTAPVSIELVPSFVAVVPK